MNRLAVLGLCGVLSCTHAPTQKPPPPPVAAKGTQVVPIPEGGPKAVPIDVSARDPADDLQSYATAIGRAIRARLILPSDVPESANAIYEITLLGNGAVAGLRAVRRSGFPAYDAAIRRAIRRAQPFPQLAIADPAQPTRMQLTFRVRE